MKEAWSESGEMSRLLVCGYQGHCSTDNSLRKGVHNAFKDGAALSTGFTMILEAHPVRSERAHTDTAATVNLNDNDTS
jgi:hypothetical protein